MPGDRQHMRDLDLERGGRTVGGRGPGCHQFLSKGVAVAEHDRTLASARPIKPEGKCGDSVFAVSADDILRTATTIVLIDYPGRVVPETLARAIVEGAGLQYVDAPSIVEAAQAG